MDFTHEEAIKNSSTDKLILGKEEVKSVDEEVQLFFKVGDGNLSVEAEIVNSGENLVTVAPVYTKDEHDDKMRNASTQTISPVSTPEDEHDGNLRHASTQTVAPMSTPEAEHDDKIRYTSIQTISPESPPEEEHGDKIRHACIQTIAPENTPEVEHDVKIRHASTQKTERKVFQQESLSTEFVSKIWTAFLAFQAFAIPAIFGMILSVVSRFEYPENDGPHQYVTEYVMMAFIGASVFIGLPFHMLAMDDLDDTVNSILLPEDISDNTTNPGKQEITSNNDEEGSIDSDSDDKDDFLSYFN